MKVYKPKFEVRENEDERRERQARDFRALTPDQLQRQQETARRHTQYEARKETRRTMSRRAIKESMER